MFSIHSKKIAAALVVAFIAVLSGFMVSCQKEISAEGFSPTEAQPDLSTKIASSVSGFVTDETDAAVLGATVQVGTSTTTTDKYGFFEVKNAEVVKVAAVVTITKPGYFKGIKTYTATANKSAFFRIKLIPKTTAGTIDAAAGGAVTLTNGLSVTLPANGVVVASSNAAYTGQVNVAVSWLNPTAADLTLIMPGDLRGLDNQGFLKLLATYGMSAVELTGTAGELLQIATGKKATLNFPLPASISGTAPATIPLWYFDETQGLWKEQGSATKSGNNYVGEVSHFSYWNCDIPLASSVQFTATVVDASGNPVPNTMVSIEFANGTYTGAHGMTDSSGFISGTIPANAQLVISVYSYYTCNNAAYSQTLTTTNVNVALGNIVLPAVSTATVTGNINDCNSTAVTNGYVIMRKDNMNFRYPVSSTGAFEFNISLCGSNAAVTFIPVDLGTQQAGNLTNFTINSGANAVGTLIACGTLIDEYINYSINGTGYNIAAPADNVMGSVNPQTTPQTFYVSGNSGTAGGVAINSVYFQFNEPGIGVGSAQTLVSFYSRQINDSTQTPSISVPINVNITEYGAVGQFIAGNFTGTLTGAPPANTPYVVTCNFRFRRN